jgi:hypothetical protein
MENGNEESGLKDTVYSPASEREQEVRNAPGGQTGMPERDPDVDGDAVNLLPGTGGPDDQGDIDVPDEEFNLDGRPFPGHASDES